MYTLMIADDEQSTRDNMIASIDWRSHGFEIVGVAGDGLSAYECLKNTRPDLAIIDIRMPGISGLELIRRTVEEGFRTRIIIVSGYDSFEYAQKALEYRVFKYLLKPFSPDELIRALEDAARDLPPAGVASGDIGALSTLFGGVDADRGPISYPDAEERALLRGISENGKIDGLCARVDAFMDAAEASNASDSAVVHCAVMLYAEICKQMMQYGYSVSPVHFTDRDWRDDRVRESLRAALKDACTDAHAQMEQASQTNQMIRMAVRYIEAHYSEKLSLNSIAEHIHISPVYLSSLFTKEVGQSITQYLQAQRIEHARQLLLETRDSVDAVSERVGYSDAKYFAQVFKRIVGVTPAAYRNQSQLHSMDC